MRYSMGEAAECQMGKLVVVPLPPVLCHEARLGQRLKDCLIRPVASRGTTKDVPTREARQYRWVARCSSVNFDLNVSIRLVIPQNGE